MVIRERSRLLLVIGVIFVLSCLSILPVSASTSKIKVGGVCKPLNKVVKVGAEVLICSKKGGKLVWVAKVAQVGSKPTPMPNPQPSTDSGPLEADGYPPNIPAPGRTCPNLNGKAEIDGASITCLANGTTGIWTLDPGQTLKPSASPKATPKPRPIPTPLTTPTASVDNKSRPSIITASKAFNDVKNILDTAPSPKSTYTMHVSPNASAALVDQANKTLPNAVKFWQSVYSPPKPVDVIYAYWSDKDWTVNAVKEAGDTPNGYDGMAAWFDSKPQSTWSGELGSGMHQGIPINGVSVKLDIVVSGPNAANRPGGMTTAPHEYTHNVQVEIAPNYFGAAPCWFSEGMAQYFAIPLAYPDSSTYFANRMMVMKDSEYGTYPFNSQRTIAEWADSLEAASHGFCGPVGGYWTGTLAVEYLVSLKGTAGVIAFIKELERTGSFAGAFLTIYGMDIPTFFTAAAAHIHDTVGDILGRPADVTTNSNAERLREYEAGSIVIVQKAIAGSKSIEISPLITLTVEDGALTPAQRAWIEDSLRFMTYVSPPTNGGKWILVFPKTMEWFLQNWDMAAEQQRYKDMFATNTAAQLVGSVHSYGGGNGGWFASFFVDPNKNWMNPDWQMRFMAQLLKPAGYASGLKGPDWFTRSFAYPIGAAYSQITSSGSYSSLHGDWVTSLSKLPQPLEVVRYEPATSGDGTENYKAPGSLANEILLNLGGIDKCVSFLLDTQKNGGDWEAQLVKSFGITKADLYTQIAAWNS